MAIYNVARYDTPSPNPITPMTPRRMRPRKANVYFMNLIGCLSRKYITNPTTRKIIRSSSISGSTGKNNDYVVG